MKVNRWILVTCALTCAGTSSSQVITPEMVREYEANVESICKDGSMPDACKQMRDSIPMMRGMLNETASTPKPTSTMATPSRTPSRTAATPSYKPFGDLPPNAGSDLQRQFWAERCKGKTNNPSDPAAMGCMDTYQILTGQKTSPYVTVGTPSSGGRLTGAATPSPTPARTGASPRSNRSLPATNGGGVGTIVNRQTGQNCIAYSTYSHTDSQWYKIDNIKVTNSCPYPVKVTMIRQGEPNQSENVARSTIMKCFFDKKKGTGCSAYSFQEGD